MSADVLPASEGMRTTAREKAGPAPGSVRAEAGWSPEKFAREQIRGLVRQVFFSNGSRPVRQVVFSALESDTDVRRLCREVGEILALETPGSIAVVGGYPRLIQGAETLRQAAVESGSKEPGPPLQQIATRLRGNLWLVPDGTRTGDPATAASLQSFLREVRGQFEYSIVQGPPVGESDKTTAMAQVADGIILVVSAQRTRRATARKMKETLEAAQARLLGTVLSDRVFPVPEAIYRRL
jgi:hypothetical protein